VLCHAIRTFYAVITIRNKIDRKLMHGSVAEDKLSWLYELASLLY